VEALITAQVNLDVGVPPVVRAAEEGHAEVVELILAADADPNSVFLGKTAFMHAASIDSVEIMQSLVEAKADLRLEDKDGKTALQYACSARGRGLVQEILDSPCIDTECLDCIIKLAPGPLLKAGLKVASFKLYNRPSSYDLRALAAMTLEVRQEQAISPLMTSLLKYGLWDCLFKWLTSPKDYVSTQAADILRRLLVLNKDPRRVLKIIRTADVMSQIRTALIHGPIMTKYYTTKLLTWLFFQSPVHVDGSDHSAPASKAAREAGLLGPLLTMLSLDSKTLKLFFKRNYPQALSQARLIDARFNLRNAIAYCPRLNGLVRENVWRALDSWCLDAAFNNPSERLSLCNDTLLACSLACIGNPVDPEYPDPTKDRHAARVLASLVSLPFGFVEFPSNFTPQSGSEEKSSWTITDEKQLDAFGCDEDQLERMQTLLAVFAKVGLTTLEVASTDNERERKSVPALTAAAISTVFRVTEADLKEVCGDSLQESLESCGQAMRSLLAAATNMAECKSFAITMDETIFQQLAIMYSANDGSHFLSRFNDENQVGKPIGEEFTIGQAEFAPLFSSIMCCCNIMAAKNLQNYSDVKASVNGISAIILQGAPEFVESYLQEEGTSSLKQGKFRDAMTTFSMGIRLLNAVQRYCSWLLSLPDVPADDANVTLARATEAKITALRTSLLLSRSAAVLGTHKKCSVAECIMPGANMCGRCMKARYCSQKHQKAHWKAGHKDLCQG
jgi:hypothetical protein